MGRQHCGRRATGLRPYQRLRKVRTGGGTNAYTFTWTDKDLHTLPAEPPVAEGATVVSALNIYRKRARTHIPRE